MDGFPRLNRRGRLFRRGDSPRGDARRGEPVRAYEDLPFAPDVDDEATDEPIDLAAVRADDAFLDALSAGADATGELDGDPELGALLSAWRREVDSVPSGELVDLDTAMRVIQESRTGSPRGIRRFVVPVASAAAVLAIGLSGVSAAAMHARPGDALWPLATVLYTDHARSIEAAASVRYELNSASSAMHAGRVSDARAALERASEKLTNVSTEDGLRELINKHESLLAQLDTAPTQPGMTGDSVTLTRSSSSVAVPPPVATKPEPSNPTTSPTQPPQTTSVTPTTPPATSTVTSTPKPGGETADSVTGRTGEGAPSGS